MLPKKSRHYTNAGLILFLLVVGTTVLAGVSTGVASYRTGLLSNATETKEDKSIHTQTQTNTEYNATEAMFNPMFMTIIQGADEEVVCPNDGSTLAKFFLCGASDVRTLSLSQSGGSYQWQRLDPNTCAPHVVDDCPTTNETCTCNTVETGPPFSLSDAGE